MVVGDNANVSGTLVHHSEIRALSSFKAVILEVALDSGLFIEV